MSRFVGGLLLVSGLAGLVLVLVFWLPASMPLMIMIVTSLLCIGCVWAGGELLQKSVRVVRSVEGDLAASQSLTVQCKTVCLKCGQQGVPDQRFCGACGSAMVVACTHCGATVVPGSRFCINCGSKLS